MRTSFQIGKVIGIPIRIHFTFLIILAIFAWFFSFENITILGFTIGFGGESISAIIRILAGIIVSILFFACVLLHELGHSYMAQKNGYKVNGITLFIFGGLSQMEEIPREPKLELKIAVIGPGVSIALGIIFFILYRLSDGIGDYVAIRLISITFGTLAFYNFLLGFFNLVPAFPIDGGRVLRALFATFMDYKRATKTASNIGKVIAVAMAIFGIFFSFWLILIAFFVYMGASQEEKSVEVSIALEGIKVKDVMSSNVISVSPDMTVGQLSEYMLRKKHMGYPVIANQKLLGIVTFSDIHGIEKDKQGSIFVENVMSKDVISLSPGDDAIDAFKLMARKNIGRLIVKEHGKVVGIVSRSDLLHAIKMKEV